MKVEIVPRKYIPLNKKYPTILGLVKMREGKVFTLVIDPLYLKWNGIKTSLEFRGERASVNTPELKRAVEQCDENLTRVSRDVTLWVADTVMSVHEDHYSDPREEKVIHLRVKDKSAFLVLDELAWFTRAM